VGAQGVALAGEWVVVAADDGCARAFAAVDGAQRGEVQVADREGDSDTCLGGIAAFGSGLATGWVREHRFSVSWLSTEEKLRIDGVTTVPLEDVDASGNILAGEPLAQGGHGRCRTASRWRNFGEPGSS
jgi:hypothetical protein